MRRLGGGILGVLVLAPALLQAQTSDFMEDWQFSGSTSNTLEVYQDFNNPAQSPFPDRGTFGQSDLSLNFQRRYSPYNQVKGQFFGTAVNNPYRSGFLGIVPERFNINWEKGDGSVPFRIDVGDFFAFTSARTVQRSLKGAQVELQPDLGGSGGWQHSVQFFTGINQQFYRQMDFNDDLTFGGSWLFSHAEKGNLAANLVVNRLESGANNVNAQRIQTVMSLSGDTFINWRGQKLEFAGEGGYFVGDDIGGNNLDDNGFGLFAEVRGRSESLPLDYSLTVSQFDEEYQPAGAAVTADLRSFAHRGGWRFDGGRSLRWRAQWDRTNFDNQNSTDTISGGLALAGPLNLSAERILNSNLDYGFTKTRNQANSTNNKSHNLSFNTTTTLNERTSGRASYSFQTQDTLGAETVITNQVTVGVDRQVSYKDLSGSLSPSITFRDIIAGNAAGEEISASLSANLNRGAWNYQASYRVARQIRDTAGASTMTQGLTGRADWSSGQHAFGFEADFSVLDRQAQATGEPLKLSAVYTYSFNKPAGRRFGDTDPLPDTFQAQPIASAAQEFDIALVRPNSDFEDVLRQVSEAGFAGGQTILEGVVVYEATAFPAVDLRQRLVLLHQGRRHRTAAVIFDPVDPTDGRALEADFQRVLSEVIRLYGRPESTFERGDFAGNIAQDISRSDLIRLAEWRTDGGTLRLGIPRRLDGQIRIELHHARSFRPPSHTLWSLNEVQ